MASSASNQEREKELLQALVASKHISLAQADIAQKDQESTGMSLDEVLIARRWVDEEKLYALAPWLQDTGETNKAAIKASQYQENLLKYRKLMDRILGEGSP